MQLLYRYKKAVSIDILFTRHYKNGLKKAQQETKGCRGIHGRFSKKTAEVRKRISRIQK
jgi:hypothetical protein